MNTRQYQFIHAIAQCQSLSLAAKKLHVSQPALSRFLKNLEKEAETPLFISYRRKLLPTPAGQIYIDTANRVLQLQRVTYQQIRSCLQDSSPEELVVGASGISGPIRLSAIIPDMYENFPALSFRIREERPDALKELLKSGEIRFAVLSYPASEEIPFTFYQFAETELLVLLPTYQKNSPQPSKAPSPVPVDLYTLKNMPFILPDETVAYAPYLDSLFAEAGFTPTVVYRNYNPYVIRSLVQRGFGAGIVTTNFVKEDADLVHAVHLLSHPKLRYGIAAIQNAVLTEAEIFFIQRFLKQQAENAADYMPNETTRILLRQGKDSC